MAFDPYTVLPTESGVVRLFTTDLMPEGDAAITAQNVQKLLGDGIDLDASKVEVFPPKVIQPVGMSTYLSEGHGILESDLEGKAAALDAMTGLVIVVPTSTFKGQSVTLDPRAGIRFVGAFHEPRPEPPRHMSDAEAAEATLQPRDAPGDPLVRHRRGWMLALAALLGAAVFVLLVVIFL